MASDRALLELQLPDRDEAPAAARKALTALNGSLHLISETRLRDAQLLVSELVSNAVRHGGGRKDEPVSIAVRVSPEAVRVEVRDHGGGFELSGLRAPPTASGGGWGLHLVASLAHRWGVDRETPHTVWFEIDRPQRDTPLASDPSPPE